MYVQLYNIYIYIVSCIFMLNIIVIEETQIKTTQVYFRCTKLDILNVGEYGKLEEPFIFYYPLYNVHVFKQIHTYAIYLFIGIRD